MYRILLAGVAVMVLAQARADDGETNKALYRSFMDQVWNKKDLAALDRYLAPDFIEHNKNLPTGLAGRKQFVTAVQAAFSDYHAEVEEVVADGDRLVARVLWTGTQDGPFQGRPPTQRKLRFWTADFFRVSGGKLAEHWDVVDSLPRAIALGLVPDPTAPPAAAGAR